MGRPKFWLGPCEVEGCGRKVHAKGLCAKHNLRLWKWKRSTRRVIPAPPPLPVWSETFMAWAAGIMEGEGYFSLERSPMVRVNLTDEDVLRKLYDGLGVGNFSGPHPPTGSQRKPRWTWYVARRRHLEALLRAIRPWMGMRRGKRIDDILERLSRPRPTDNFHLYVAKHVASSSAVATG
jgi:hypothetical protein